MTGVNYAACHVYKPLVSSTSSQIVFPRHSLCFDRKLGKVSAGIREVLTLAEDATPDVIIGNSLTETGNDVALEASSPDIRPFETYETPGNVLPTGKFEVVDSFTRVTDTVRSSISDFQVTGEKFITGIKDKVTGSINDAETSLKHVYDELNGSVLEALKGGQDAISKKLTVDLTSPFRSGTPINDGLKKVVIFVKKETDGILGNAGHVISETYSSIKMAAPSEVQGTLETIEKKTQEISVPVSSALEQVSDFVKGVESSLGIDTENPIFPVIILAGGSILLGTLYYQSQYGGYAGDLLPETVIDLLRKERNILLVDIRPQALKDKDGVPDVRRASRSKLASIDPLQVERSLRSSLRNADDVDNVLTATIIRNLRNVKANTKVVVMDANGTCSKSIARALRKAGVQKSYRLAGGFNAWTRSGLKSKSEGAQTPLAVLKEDAEEFVDELKPTPLLVLGVILGSATFAYAVYEWEKTLQLIGVFAILQAVYKRLDSYESAEDLKADMRMLQKPFKVAYQGILQVSTKPSEKLELATSPSTTAVQDRVIQAAAKHGPVISDPAEQNADESTSGAT